MVVRVRLDLAYDGTDFAGWARQPGLRTIQGEVEKALAGLYSKLGPISSLVVAGRTDAGVHARGQVAHLDLSDEQASKIEVSRIALSVNGMLSTMPSTLPSSTPGGNQDIVVRRTTVSDEGFDARFSALWRRYEYRIADTLPARSPLTRRTTAWTTKPLDVDRMNDAATQMLGLHDWAAFCRPRPFATTIRTLQEFMWVRTGDDTVVASLEADAFCHSMVRALVGATVAVGEGRLSVDDVVRLREALERTSAFKVMPARGLTLTEVGYPDAAGLAVRASETRARRTREALIAERAAQAAQAQRAAQGERSHRNDLGELAKLREMG
ncbi:tRNA pseudouridine(38-40) synthase TruA [Subtercola frigoramans]|uniref:tRNA pseudouridine synthase A n=1 Tax=Subtercola frigoramans TaxID=120298 RepID=A0ABS2L2R8_9MICO|nr:tRNA pseudouridine(38-40) synthase TruA [Subtercola frigoramans]MBM7471377.1 tRNA pseudouridine38-40 synthase [Subtercola frigoramans]